MNAEPLRFKFNVPNAITTFRLILTIPLVMLILNGETISALIVFVIGIISDMDGAVARRLGQVTQFGGIYDFVADGIFLLGGIIALIFAGHFSKFSLVMLALLGLVNVLRVVFVRLFIKKTGKIKSTIWSKLSGLLAAAIVPFALLDVGYLGVYILFVVVFTSVIIGKRWWDYKHVGRM